MATRNQWVAAVGLGMLATGLIRAAVLTILGEGPRWIQSWPLALGLVVVGAVLCWIGSRQRFST